MEYHMEAPMEQSEYDDLLRQLVRIVANQDVMNERQDLTNQRLALALDRLDVTLQAIKDILGRGNGH
jgi:hypothetical protein